MGLWRIAKTQIIASLCYKCKIKAYSITRNREIPEALTLDKELKAAKEC